MTFYQEELDVFGAAVHVRKNDEILDSAGFIVFPGLPAGPFYFTRGH